MTTRTLALILFLLTASNCIQDVHAENEKMARNRKWETAVRPDVPATPVEKEVAESASKTSAPLFYSTKENLPPLPFNPFPDFNLFDLGDNRFAYDDRAVDYQSRSISSAAFRGENSNGSTFSESFACSYSSNDLWLNITTTNTTGFLLDICNTTPSVFYGVGAKSVLDNDPFNSWTLVSVFEAQSTNEQLVGTASAPTRFYNAVNLDEYVGPIVSIVSPSSGTVTGAADLQVRVTDILPLTSLRVHVDGVQVGVIVAGQNGIISVPTYLFANGEHEIWVEAANEGVLVDTDGDTVGDEISPFNGWASTTVNFTNEVYMENYSPLYSVAGSITLQYTAINPQNYTFEVFDLGGDLLHTESGQSTNGAINTAWNFTDLLNNPVSDSAYVFSLASRPQSGGPTNKMLTTNFFDNGGVKVGKYVISYGTWPSSSLNNGLAGMNAYVSARVNSAAINDDAIIGSGREDYTTITVGFSSDPFPIRLATQTNDLNALTNALKNSSVGSWLFEGHSGQNNLIHDGDPNNPYLTVDLTSKQVAALLGNSYGFTSNGFSASYSRRLFSTFITGCGAASSGTEYPDATGTPMGVPQVGNPQIKKSAFLGFSELSYVGSTKNSWINRIHFEWLDGSDYDTPLATAINRANTAYPAVIPWGPRLFGYGPLEYNGDESR